jgi:hypothetical protein
MEQVSAGVALLSAIVAVVVALWGLRERQRAFLAQERELQRQSEHWKNDFEAQQGELERQAQHWKDDFEAARRREQASLMKDFLLEQYRYRLAAYGAVLKTLGAVSDVDFAYSNDLEAMRRDQDRLTTAADALYDHLYGEAGLLMTMPTRNVLHWARRECLTFLDSPERQGAGNALVKSFYLARRYIRADLDLVDDRSPEGLTDLVERLNVEAKVDPCAV